MTTSLKKLLSNPQVSPKSKLSQNWKIAHLLVLLLFISPDFLAQSEQAKHAASASSQGTTTASSSQSGASRTAQDLVTKFENMGREKTTPSHQNTNVSPYQDASIIKNSQAGYSRMPEAPAGVYGSVPKTRAGAWSDSRIPKPGNRYGQIPPVAKGGANSAPSKAPNSQYQKPPKPRNYGYDKMPGAPANGGYGSVPQKPKSGAWSDSRIPKQGNRYGQIPPAARGGANSAPAVAPNQYQNAPKPRNYGYDKMPGAPINDGYGSVPQKPKSGAWSDSKIPKQGNRYGQLPPIAKGGANSAPAAAPNPYQKPPKPANYGYDKMPGAPHYGPPPKPPVGNNGNGQYQNLPKKPAGALDNNINGRSNTYDNAPKPKNKSGYESTSAPLGGRQQYDTPPKPKGKNGYESTSAPLGGRQQYDTPPKPRNQQSNQYQDLPKKPAGAPDNNLSGGNNKPRYDDAPPPKSTPKIGGSTTIGGRNSAGKIPTLPKKPAPTKKSKTSAASKYKKSKGKR